MGNIDYIQKLPESVYKIAAGSNNYKLFSLFTEELDYLNSLLNTMLLIPEYKNQQGEILNLVGKIVSITRQGRSDSSYIKYIYIGLLRYRSTGSIDDLNNICTLILDDYFLYLRELFEQDTSHPIASDYTYLDGSLYLDGDNYLGASIFQPAYFEIVIQSGCPAELIEIITSAVYAARVCAIKYRIREE